MRRIVGECCRRKDGFFFMYKNGNLKDESRSKINRIHQLQSDLQDSE